MLREQTTIFPRAQKRILIVEDEFAVANDLRSILENANYEVTGIAYSVAKAMDIISNHLPDLVLLDIQLKGPASGIDLARRLAGMNVPFIYVSANTTASVLEEVNATAPYGFIVKPFRDRDVLVALEIAHYRHAHSIEQRIRHEQALQIAITNALSELGDWESRLLKVARLLQPEIPFDYLIIGLENERAADNFPRCNFFRVARDEYQTLRPREFSQITGLNEQSYRAHASHVRTHPKGLSNSEDFRALCRQIKFYELVMGI